MIIFDSHLKQDDVLTPISIKRRVRRMPKIHPGIQNASHVLHRPLGRYSDPPSQSFVLH